jgi:hypothetical protein
MKIETVVANMCRMCLGTDILGEISIHSQHEGQTVAEMIAYLSGIDVS